LVQGAQLIDPEQELPRVVEDEAYREVFLKLSRNLAPTGKTFERLEVRDVGAPSAPAVAFAPDTRRELNMALRKYRPPRPLKASEESVEIRGILRGVHLDKDWLEVQAREPNVGTIHIDKAGDVLDDVVGPMVNRPVIVRAVRRRGKFEYQDIEPEE
jgi:hypothetical protein